MGETIFETFPNAINKEWLKNITESHCVIAIQTHVMKTHQ